MIPTTLKQFESICGEVERLTHGHPELKEKINECYMMPESERIELEEIIHHILAEAERVQQKYTSKTAFASSNTVCRKGFQRGYPSTQSYNIVFSWFSIVYKV